MSETVERYGVKEQVTAISPLDVNIEEIRTLGHSVVDSGLAPETISLLKSRLDVVHQRQVEEAGGNDRLATIGEQNTVRALLAYDEIFLDLALNPTVQEICRGLLGDYFILMLQNATLNPPERKRHHQTSYHRDLPYQHFVSSRPLAVNALLCLDPFSSETGSTIVLTGSHKMEAFPSDAYVRKMEQSTTAPAGSFIMFDSMLYHRAGINASQNSRYAINLCYCLPILKQQISLPRLLKGRWSDKPHLARLLGYESEPADSVVEWRANRAQRLISNTY